MNPSDKEQFSALVLDHYEDPYHCGPLEQCTHSSTGSIPVCGDTICAELRISQESTIEEAWFQGDGCLLSQAAASILMEQAEGMSLEEFRNFSANDMLKLVGTPLLINRQKCCLLPWRVMQEAVASAIDHDIDEDPHFGGPSLREES